MVVGHKVRSCHVALLISSNNNKVKGVSNEICVPKGSISKCGLIKYKWNLMQSHLMT